MHVKMTYKLEKKTKILLLQTLREDNRKNSVNSIPMSGVLLETRDLFKDTWGVIS